MAAVTTALVMAVGGCGDDSEASSGRSAVIAFRYEEPATGTVDPAAVEAAVGARLQSIGIEVDAVNADGAGAVTVAVDDDRLAELARDLLAQQGVVRFRPVLLVVPGESPDVPLSVGQDAADQEVVLAERDPQGGVSATYRLGPTLVDVTSAESATAVEQPGAGWSVQLVLREAAGEELNRAAVLCSSKAPECPVGQLAVVLDGEVLSAPDVTQPSYERDRVELAAVGDEVTARRLATVLNAGPLPVALTPTDG